MECIKLHDKTGNMEYDMEEDCISHLFGGGFSTYEKIAEFCLEHGLNTIYDIGCAYGHQSQVFLNNDLEYVGIEQMGYIKREDKVEEINFYNRDECHFLIDRYPFKIDIKSKPKTLAVSIMCLGWGVYLPEKHKTFDEQFTALSNDFDHAIVKIPNDKIMAVAEYFSSYEIVQKEKIGSIIYYYNK